MTTSSSIVGWRLASRTISPVCASRGKRASAQGDALVELDAVADLGRLADDDAGAVIDEESAADRGAGMDVDAGLAVCVFGHHPRDQRHAQAKEHVGQAIDGDGAQARVAEDDLVETLGGGVAVEGGLDVLGERSAQLGRSRPESESRFLRPWPADSRRSRRPRSRSGKRGRSARSAGRAETSIRSPTWSATLPRFRFCRRP